MYMTIIFEHLCNRILRQGQLTFPIHLKTQITSACKNRVGEAVLACIHKFCFEKKLIFFFSFFYNFIKHCLLLVKVL